MRELKFGKGKVKEYQVRKFDDFNFVIEREYRSKAKGHEGKLMTKIIGYYPTLEFALNEVASLQLEDSVFEDLFKGFKESVSDMKVYYKNNN